MAAEKFRSLSPAEFFYRNREIAGFSNPARALYQTIRELVENSLDATDTHGILPVIKVWITRSPERGDFYTVCVEDNGIGVPPQHVPQAFGQVLYSSKYTLRQSRGMFGLGAKMAILYGQITTGKPVEVITSPINSKRVYYFKIMIDIKHNKPIVLERRSWEKKRDWHGTRISVTLEGDWSRSKSRIIEYFRRTAMVAPYAEIVFRDPDGRYYHFPRATEKLPQPPKEVKPHPKGIDLEMLKMLIAASNAQTLLDFLVETFQGVGPATARNFLEYAGLDPNLNPHELSLDQLKLLAQKLKEYPDFRPPRTDPLSPLGPEIIEIGLKQILKPEFTVAVTRKPSSYGGHPFIVEVGIAYGGQIPPSDEPLLFRFANKIPLLYDEKSDVSWKVVSQGIDWKQYLVTFPAPLAVLVHVCSTKIPYRGVGKESIADVPEIEHEIKSAVREAARKLRLYLSKKRKEEEAKKKLVTILKYVPEVARSLSVLSKKPGSKNGLSEEMIEAMLMKLVQEKVAAKSGVEKVERIVLSIE